MLNKSFIKFDIRNKLITLRYEMWGKLVTKIMLLISILEVLLLFIALIIGSTVGYPYRTVIVVCMSTVPNLFLTVFALVVSYLYQELCKKDNLFRAELYNELDLLENFDTLSNEELDRQINTLRKFNEDEERKLNKKWR